MGISISLHDYSYDKLCDEVRRVAKDTIQEDRTAEYFIENVLPEFGVRAGDRFLTLWNEYYEDYNSGLELMHAADLYFGTEGTYFGSYGYVPAANAYEILEELEIKPIGPVVEDDDY